MSELRRENRKPKQWVTDKAIAGPSNDAMQHHAKTVAFMLQRKVYDSAKTARCHHHAAANHAVYNALHNSMKTITVRRSQVAIGLREC